MTRVYVDVAATALDGEGGASTADALRALRYLVELGHGVTLVTEQPDGLSDELRAVGTVIAAVPARPEEGGWYLTTDVERCLGMSARVRTVLVGAAPPAGSVRRCDTVARDLQAAVLEVLASEAMAPGSPTRL